MSDEQKPVEGDFQESESFDDVMKRLDKDLRAASKLIGRDEARYLVDSYYQYQKFRIRCERQLADRDESEPAKMLEFIRQQTATIERNIYNALNVFTKEYRVGNWLQSITGVGPVISAGLLTHLDISRAPFFGNFWNFAGLNPTVKWTKGQKRPWNAKLKTLMFKAADCFVKFQNHKNDFYGKIYLENKARISQYNMEGRYKEQCVEILEKKNFRDDTVAKGFYEKGMLPPGHIHMRAMRKVEKLFLAHVHQVFYEDYYGQDAPRPYILVFDPTVHTHFVSPPNYPWTGAGKGLKEMGN